MTTTRTTHQDRDPGPDLDSVLHTLRALVPDRRLSHLESMRLAEQQADLLRDILNVTDDTFPAAMIEQIPFITVKLVPELPVSGLAFWGDHTWKIHLRAGEPVTRRRFNLLHEFKHIIDHPHQARLYDDRPHVAAGERELVADYFAACALMPADRLREATAETPDRYRIAARFHVDSKQLARRLADLDLNPADPAHLSIYVTERRIT